MISILTPFKNTGLFLREMINSVLTQSHHNWQLILINDHSTDNSKLIALEYAQKDIRVQVLDNQGSGIIQALQTGYKKATGDYITRMDSDDVMHEQKLELLLAGLQGSQINTVATAKVKYFADRPIGDGYEKYEKWLNNLCDSHTHFQEIYKECVIASPCWMMHKDTFDQIGGFNAEVYPEDYELVFRMYKHKLKVKAVDQVLHYWRDYNTRTSRTHEHYADNRFLELKTNYFIDLDLDKTKEIVLWGAGKKGKFIAQKLNDQAVNLTWVCDNPKKIGKQIYSSVLQDYKTLHFHKNQQHIVSIAEPHAQLMLKNLLLSKGVEHYFFC